MDRSISTPIKEVLIRFLSFCFTSPKVSPATEIDPISGNKIVPSNLTVRSKIKFFEPDRITVNWSLMEIL